MLLPIQGGASDENWEVARTFSGLTAPRLLQRQYLRLWGLFFSYEADRKDGSLVKVWRARWPRHWSGFAPLQV